MMAPSPAKGDHMSIRDFSLGLQARYLGREAVPKPKCFSCGQTGHMARDCPRSATFDDLDDYYDYSPCRGFADFAPDGYIDSSGNEW